MTKTEVKKALYRQKPVAKYIQKTSDPYRKNYTCMVMHSDGYEYSIKFAVPYSEMGDTFFDRIMPAQLLIRWMQ